MGPHIPLNFFMTRLLFVEKNKVNSLKAKSDKQEVLIVVDNPKILPEQNAKSLPPVPFPPAAPESPVPVEGWKGVKVGGWLGLGGSNKKLNPPAVYSGGNTGEATSRFANLKVEDDDTEITEESVSQTFDSKPADDDMPALEPATKQAALPEPMKPTQHFPSNSARSNSARSLSGKKSGSIGRKLTGLQRPSMKKKSSSKSAASMLRMKGDSSPSSSGAED